MTISDPQPEPASSAADPDKGAPATGPVEDPAAGVPDAASDEAVGADPATTDQVTGPDTSPESPAEATTASGEAGAGDAIPNLHLHSLWQDLVTGLGFFPRLPVRSAGTALSDAARVFSLIGALIGLGATLAYVLG